MGYSLNNLTCKGECKMESYKCEVERIDRYVVEFDESVINEEWMEDFRQVFFDFYDLEEHAEHIAQMRARFGNGFIEGYGIPLEDGEIPYWVISDTQKGQVNHAINMKIISEDDYLHVDVDFVE